MVVGGGGDNGPIVSDYAPMGMGCEFDDLMAMVLVPIGRGLSIYWSRSSPIYWLRGVSRIWWQRDGGL